MSLSLTENRQRRGLAKGAITKVSKSVKLMQCSDSLEYDVDSLQKLLDSLYKADESFHQFHQSVYEQDHEMDEDQYTDALLEHEAMVTQVKKSVLDLKNITEAYDLTVSMMDALTTLERSSSSDYHHSRGAGIERLERLVLDFQEARSKRGARDNSRLKDIKDDAADRLLALQRTHDASKPSSVDATPTVTEVIHQSRGLKTQLPPFDGNVLGWKTYKTLYDSVMNKETGLTDAEKKVHLLKTMSTPEAKAVASKIIGQSDTHEEAMAGLIEVYEQNRVVHAHHHKELFQDDHFKDRHEDIGRLRDRIRLNCRGIKQAKAFTAEQMVTAHFESLMAQPLVRRWRDHSLKHSDTPPMEDLLVFLDAQYKATATSEAVLKDTDRTPKPQNNKPQSHKPGGKTVFHLQTNNQAKCSFCQSDHFVLYCPQFRQESVSQRRSFVQTASLCGNCLSSRHKTSDCKNVHRCKECSGRHHSMLHEQRTTTATTGNEPLATVNFTTGYKPGLSRYSLPRTAIVNVRAAKHTQRARAQLDSGATISLISRSLANTLLASPIPHSSASIKGLTGNMRSSHQVELTLIGDGGESLTSAFHVVETIPDTESMADSSKIFSLPFLAGLPLADPEYRASARIDLILSQGTANTCHRDGVRLSECRGLKAENSIFGWSVGGHDTRSNQQGSVEPICLKVSSTDDDTNKLMVKFWELEHLPTSDVPHTTDEQQALAHFHDTHYRQDDGRYCVSLPRKYPTPVLGNSRDIAIRRFHSNERSLKRQGLWQPFADALQDYSQLGHAEPVPPEDIHKSSEYTYYVPIHGVLKPCSTTTRLRAVCDASSKTSSGYSLNDTLLPGPSLYPHLTTILNKFRTHKVGMSADIGKMFREIALHPSECDYHRFLMRNASNELVDWRMTRLAFGATSSPFLATQVLRQLAQDHRSQYPVAAAILESCLYVDDCLTGADTVQEAQLIRQELNSLVSCARMTFRKWRSSSTQLLQTIPLELQETSDLHIHSSPGEYAKALGLHWDTTNDALHISMPDLPIGKIPTKRQVASLTAKIFDVLGWYTPATLHAKVILQQSWKLGLDWDEVLPDDLQSRWADWLSDLDVLGTHPIPRYTGLHEYTPTHQTLHGFSDASMSAYGGVVYLVSYYSNDRISISLIASRVRVSPLKTVTIPRLELCGALLLSQLLESVSQDLCVVSENVFAWSDSAVVLGWLNKAPSRLNTFVANRVSKITEFVDATKWRYVPTASNPADLLSRGVTPTHLMDSTLWWNGPDWLSQSQQHWPRRPDINGDRELPDLRPSVLRISLPTEEIGLHTSSFHRLVRIAAWILRFIKHSKGEQTIDDSGALSLPELAHAKTVLLRHCQRVYFSKEIELLQTRTTLSSGHSLASLSPFLDKDGLMRVGGRLQKAGLGFDTTHPIILDPKSHTVALMVRSIHQDLLHAGPTTVMATIATSFHIPRLKPLLRKISRRCVTCQRAYAHVSRQLMGELPTDRTRPTKPFSVVGLDFAGPLHIKQGYTRKPVLIKVYVCIFICFSTRAVHIEVVTNMTTAAFVAALSRFVARRGIPSTIYSDNGTNFTGANTELQHLHQITHSASARESIIPWASRQEITWCFSPARAPHFGGLWEAAVKLMKLILKKVIGDVHLKHEELCTVTAQVEAVMNSRPLIPADSPSDDAIEPLTPGHFLIGRPLTSLPSQTDTLSKISTLRRWNLVQRLSYEIWNRWYTGYLLLLQRRSKWKTPDKDFQVDDVVLVRDQDAFNRSWPMGRIVALYPGKDKKVRVVDVLVQGKVYRRPIVNLIRLLTDDVEQSVSGGVCPGSGDTADAAADECPLIPAPPSLSSIAHAQK